MKKKLIFWGLFFITLIIFITMINPLQLTTFTNGESTENLTFITNQNITRNISIYRYSNITSAYLNLSGYTHQVSTAEGAVSSGDTNNLFFKPSELNSTYYECYYKSCEERYWNGTVTGNSLTLDYPLTLVSVDVDEQYAYALAANLSDGNNGSVEKFNISTGAHVGTIITEFDTISDEVSISDDTNDCANGIAVYGDYLYVTGSALTGAPSYFEVYEKDGTHVSTHTTSNVATTNDVKAFKISKLKLDNGNFTTDCADFCFFATRNYGTTDYLRVWNSSISYLGTVTHKYDWLRPRGLMVSNISRWGSYVDLEIMVGSIIADAVGYTNFSISDLDNPFIEINNTQIWSHSGEFNVTKNKTADFSSVLNEALNNGECDCSGCTLLGNNCSINFTFHSDTIGLFGYSSLEIDYIPKPISTLSYPSNDSWTSANEVFECNATDIENLANATLYIWNSDGSLNLTNSTDITGKDNSTNFTHTFTETATYYWNCLIFNNNTVQDWADNFTLNVDIDNPVINLNTPTNNQYINTANVYFNYTPTHDSQTLETCELWGNFTGTFSLNQSNSSITEGTVNYFNLSLDDKSYLWNVRCNVSETGNNAFSASNYTFTLDTINPSLEIDYPKASPVYQCSMVNIKLNYSVSDLNLDRCEFNVTSNGDISTEHTIISDCSNVTFNVSYDNTVQTLSLVAYDLAGNVNLTTRLIYVDTDNSGCAGSSPTGGGLSSQDEPSVDLGFCGDDICQDGKDERVNRGETFYNCPEDCSVTLSFEDWNLDTIIFNCLGEAEGVCLWKTNPGILIIFVFVGGMLLFTVFFSFEPEKKGIKKFVYINPFKKRRRRK